MSACEASIFRNACLSRDARFDGLFFVAVKTTGIYCRPICPAPTPKVHNVCFFASAAAASAAGFRPCLRCRPELAPLAPHPTEDTVERALAMIEGGALATHSVEQLASTLGCTPRHLLRLFLKKVGVGPLRVHETRRLLLAKQLLTETRLPVTQVAFAAGFASLRRFNDAFRRGCSLTPSSLRKRQHRPLHQPLVLRLPYRPPFDFAATLRFLATRALPGIELVDDVKYQRIVGDRPTSTLVTVSHCLRRAEVLLQLSQVEPRQLSAIVSTVRRVFDLNADCQAIERVLSKVACLKETARLGQGLRIPGGWSGFEVAIRAIVGQQVSVAGAGTLLRRMVETYGELRADAPPGLNRMFPTVDVLAEASFEGIGLTQSRVRAIHGLAAAVLDRRVHFGPGQRLADFVGAMIELEGIGPWTAHYVALRGLSHPDAFPAGDLVLKRALSGSTRGREAQAVASLEQARPFRAYAAVKLWHQFQLQR
jgi:AraC family transcriptional regulator, regulatory protein of adaptative response / DNA-3-methyladenine glycosylase II